ncbi:MAG: cell division protein FtsW [Phycisphaerales bacterium]|jgi:cell division protein FtsW|nr:cell division protein FtsW [Phycisphaerales bacterium]
MLRPGQVVALCVIALLTVGVVMVNSAGMTVLAEGVSPRALLLSRATIYMVLAVAAMFAASRLPLRRLAGYFGEPDPALARPGAPLFSGLSFLISPAVLFVVLLGLVYAPVIGKEVNGANRWIRLPVPGLGDALSVQPSEIVKWGMIGAIAWYCCRRAPVLSQFWRGLFPALAFTGAMAIFIVVEDLGTGVLVVAGSCVILLAAGARFWHFMMFVPLGLAGLGLAIFKSPYRVQRVLAFMNPYGDAEGSGYHMIQSMAAVAGGEVFGRGLGHGQQKFGYLPEDETDFLFAIVCEELGVAGAAAVIGVLLLLIWTGLGIVKRERDSFLRLMGLGIIATVGIQAIINLAVVTGMAPTKGIALPLVSRGGSGWILTAFSLGLLWAIDRTQSRSLLAGDEEGVIETPSVPPTPAA